MEVINALALFLVAFISFELFYIWNTPIKNIRIEKILYDKLPKNYWLIMIAIIAIIYIGFKYSDVPQLYQFIYVFLATPLLAYGFGLTLFIIAHIMDYVSRYGIISFIKHLPVFVTMV